MQRCAEYNLHLVTLRRWKIGDFACRGRSERLNICTLDARELAHLYLPSCNRKLITTESLDHIFVKLNGLSGPM